MSKKEINIKDLKKFLLAPGNIFWKKNTGDEILISKKGEVSNFELLEKINLNKQQILIENDIDHQMLHEASQLFKAYCREILVPDKNSWKDKIKVFLNEYFINKDRPQFELNMITWEWFSSEETKKIGIELINRDEIFYIRTMTLATDLCLLAMMTGHYDDKFLINYYKEIFICFNELSKKQSVIKLKNNLEECRTLNGFNNESMNCVLESDAKAFFEEEDGTGLYQISPNEMSEMEYFEMKINHFISFLDNNDKNLLILIKNKHLNFGSEYEGLVNQLLVQEKELAAS